MEKTQLDKTLLTLRWNTKYNCLEVMRVLFTKGTPADYMNYLIQKAEQIGNFNLILDKSQKVIQDAAATRAEPGNELSGDCNYDIIKFKKEE